MHHTRTEKQLKALKPGNLLMLPMASGDNMFLLTAQKDSSGRPELVRLNSGYVFGLHGDEIVYLLSPSSLPRTPSMSLLGLDLIHPAQTVSLAGERYIVSDQAKDDTRCLISLTDGRARWLPMGDEVMLHADW